MTSHRTARTASAILLIAFLASALPPLSTGQPARRNLAAFSEKLRAAKPVTIAYLGGSATSGAGASDANKTCYRALVTSWLRARHPSAQITEINAGVAGTGSLYGALRVRRDVIAHKPDLVFVEFAAGDAASSEDAVKKSVEGILRQLLGVPQPPEVVLVYAATPDRAARVAWHESVAEYYQIPALNLQDAVWQALGAGHAPRSAFWKDGLSAPDLLDGGHRLYADAIAAFLAAQEKLRPSPPLKNLPPPFLSDELTYGELKPFAEVKHGAEWRAEPSRDRAFPSALLASDKAGAQVEAIFDGSAVGITFRAGPDGGVIECLIDGKPAPAPLARIDCYDPAAQLRTKIIPGGLALGEHKLTIRLLNEKNPKSAGHHVRLGYLVLGGQRAERL